MCTPVTWAGHIKRAVVIPSCTGILVDDGVDTATEDVVLTDEPEPIDDEDTLFNVVLSDASVEGTVEIEFDETDDEDTLFGTVDVDEAVTWDVVITEELLEASADDDDTLFNDVGVGVTGADPDAIVISEELEDSDDIVSVSVRLVDDVIIVVVG